MTESEIYKGLSVLTKSRDKWEESIPYVSSLLVDTLQWMAGHDAHPIVRIHSAGAIRVIRN